MLNLHDLKNHHDSTSRYESWLAGEDLGHHPCDDPKTVAMSIAPPPSAEEFLVNKTNNDREVRCQDMMILVLVFCIYLGLVCHVGK